MKLDFWIGTKRTMQRYRGAYGTSYADTGDSQTAVIIGLRIGEAAAKIQARTCM